jgi:hypothetical protein
MQAIAPILKIEPYDIGNIEEKQWLPEGGITLYMNVGELQTKLQTLVIPIIDTAERHCEETLASYEKQLHTVLYSVSEKIAEHGTNLFTSKNASSSELNDIALLEKEFASLEARKESFADLLEEIKRIQGGKDE